MEYVDPTINEFVRNFVPRVNPDVYMNPDTAQQLLSEYENDGISPRITDLIEQFDQHLDIESNRYFTKR